MSLATTSIRRLLIVVAVVASVLAGFGAIRAASAWTATAAPLTTAPVSVESLQSNLADESARSADLAARLALITTRADELSVALAAAQTRIVSDAQHADQLATDLAAARKKLATLEKSIRAANAVRVASATTTRVTTSGFSGEREHEGGDDD